MYLLSPCDQHTPQEKAFCLSSTWLPAVTQEKLKCSVGGEQLEDFTELQSKDKVEIQKPMLIRRRVNSRITSS